MDPTEKDLFNQIETAKINLQKLLNKRVEKLFTPEYYKKLSDAYTSIENSQKILNQAIHDANDYRSVHGKFPPCFYCVFTSCDDHTCKNDDYCRYELDSRMVKYFGK
jgi:hypothetical protein